MVCATCIRAPAQHLTMLGTTSDNTLTPSRQQSSNIELNWKQSETLCDKHNARRCPRCIPRPLQKSSSFSRPLTELLGRGYDTRWRITQLDAHRQHDPRFDPGEEREQRGTPAVANCSGGG